MALQVLIYSPGFSMLPTRDTFRYHPKRSTILTLRDWTELDWKSQVHSPGEEIANAHGMMHQPHQALQTVIRHEGSDLGGHQ